MVLTKQSIVREAIKKGEKNSYLFLTHPTTHNTTPTLLIPTPEKLLLFSTRLDHALPLTKRALLKAFQLRVLNLLLLLHPLIQLHQLGVQDASEFGFGERLLAIGGVHAEK